MSIWKVAALLGLLALSGANKWFTQAQVKEIEDLLRSWDWKYIVSNKLSSSDKDKIAYMLRDEYWVDDESWEKYSDIDSLSEKTKASLMFVLERILDAFSGDDIPMPPQSPPTPVVPSYLMSRNWRRDEDDEDGDINVTQKDKSKKRKNKTTYVQKLWNSIPAGVIGRETRNHKRFGNRYNVGWKSRTSRKFEWRGRGTKK